MLQSESLSPSSDSDEDKTELRRCIKQEIDKLLLPPTISISQNAIDPQLLSMSLELSNDQTQQFTIKISLDDCNIECYCYPIINLECVNQQTHFIDFD